MLLDRTLIMQSLSGWACAGPCSASRTRQPRCFAVGQTLVLPLTKVTISANSWAAEERFAYKGRI